MKNETFLFSLFDIRGKRFFEIKRCGGGHYPSWPERIKNKRQVLAHYSSLCLLWNTPSQFLFLNYVQNRKDIYHPVGRLKSWIFFCCANVVGGRLSAIPSKCGARNISEHRLSLRPTNSTQHRLSSVNISTLSYSTNFQPAEEPNVYKGPGARWIQFTPKSPIS